MRIAGKLIKNGHKPQVTTRRANIKPKTSINKVDKVGPRTK